MQQVIVYKQQMKGENPDSKATTTALNHIHYNAFIEYL